MDDTAGSRDDSTESHSELPGLVQAELPLVFQCNKCRTIIGDSTAWICGDEGLETISLRYAAANVSVGHTLETATEGADMGSTFIKLTCGACKHSLGKMYKATPNNLDHFRNAFTFSVHSIDSFQTGSADHTAENLAISSPEDLLTVANAKFLYAQIRKSQSMIVDLHKKITLVESQLKKTSSGSSAKNDGLPESYGQNANSPVKTVDLNHGIRPPNTNVNNNNNNSLGILVKENSLNEGRKRKYDDQKDSPNPQKTTKRRSRQY